jgi:hypothetical protein
MKEMNKTRTLDIDTINKIALYYLFNNIKKLNNI